MRADAIRLLKTLEHACGYFPRRIAQNLVIDPLAADLAGVYAQVLARGYRRAGGHIYRPSCPGCRACVATRIPVARFAPDRSQRRNLARNADLEVRVVEPKAGEEHLDLYQRYLRARHPGGGMDEAGADDFQRFLLSPWPVTRFLELRDAGRLLAVAVTDVLPTGWSAVYTFYEPEAAARGLGNLAVLSQIEGARAAGAPWLYLGYWIEGHAKMGYKTRFRPIQLLVGDRWVEQP